MKNTSNRQEGLTLIETLVALFIILVGIMAVTNLFMYINSQGKGEQQKADALALASEYLETCKGVFSQDYYFSLGLQGYRQEADGTWTLIDPPVFTAQETRNGVVYDIVYSLASKEIDTNSELIPDSPQVYNNQLMQVSVAVYWPQGASDPRQVMLTTFVR